MDHSREIESLRRALRWQRLGLILLGLTWLCGAAGIPKLFEAEQVLAEHLFCQGLDLVEATGEKVRGYFSADKEASFLAIKSPNEKNSIRLTASDDGSHIHIVSGYHELLIDESFMELIDDVKAYRAELAKQHAAPKGMPKAKGTQSKPRDGKPSGAAAPRKGDDDNRT